jgi:hypothetical protein
VTVGLKAPDKAGQASGTPGFAQELAADDPSRSVQNDAVGQSGGNAASGFEPDGHGEASEAVDAVEAALAGAITKAAAAGEWAALEALTRELRARREVRNSVVDLASVRSRRGSDHA